ncbi:alpha/beta fold hydrolase [Amycolatopsis pithecellobii]|uniref:Alpha/beta fold hydrolase n=1 Tax=Amycolatopsis pithecellobii TaxID=664692 RepID=A0A6N7Z8P7_9PSEU|nr:alpha/beta fold hydrolase [Amycolatopsis pithecellobii]MTD58234.1 alpha/beta fold hydrolase [Amycolatopsis pithecellobii]
MPTIDVNGARIAYTDTGPHDAPTVLFGHGLLFSGWMFHPQIAALRERYRCVTIDWRGQGASPPAPAGYDMDTLTADAVALIEKLDLAPVHWVGLSMGGFVGQRLAARHGELLRSLTLLDTSATAEGPRKARRQKLLARIQQLAGIKTVLPQVKPLLFGPVFLADPAGQAIVDEWVRRICRVDRGAVRRAVLGVACRQPITGELAAIRVPTLVVVGADDKATPPPESERIAAAVSGAQLRIVPDCGHTSTLEQPEAITALLEKFLAGAC